MKQEQSWLSQWLENWHPAPSPPAPSTDVWLTHAVLTLDKHVQCLSEENPVVLRATWPGEVAGRIVYCNINFCLITNASEEWKKKKGYQLFCCFVISFSPSWSKAGGRFFVLRHFSGILCYRHESKKLFSKVRSLRRLACRRDVLVGGNGSSKKEQESHDWEGHYGLCLTSQGHHPRPGSALAGRRCHLGRQRLLSTPQRLGPGT